MSNTWCLHGEDSLGLAYDPWGKRRNIMMAAGTPDTKDLLFGKTADRGFTEHQHLDEIGIIHMNGRVYDPLMGRFMSADTTIPNPNELQSFNRYSYARNNPLNLADPSGFCDVGYCGRNNMGTGDGGTGDYN